MQNRANELLATYARGSQGLSRHHNSTPESEQVYLYLLLGTVAVAALILVYKAMVESCYRMQKNRSSSAVIHRELKERPQRKKSPELLSRHESSSHSKGTNSSTLIQLSTSKQEISPAKRKHLDGTNEGAPHRLITKSAQALQLTAKQDERRVKKLEIEEHRQRRNFSN